MRHTDSVSARWHVSLISAALILGAVATVIALDAWRADNQLPDTTTFPAYLGGIAGAVGLLAAAIGGFRSRRCLGWAIALNSFAIVAAIGALARYTALPYGH